MSADSNHPSSAFAAFPQSMDFLKQFWAQAAGSTAGAAAGATTGTQASGAMPGMNPSFAQAMGSYMAPTFDLDELEKRMGDLKTVLQFMELNTNILRQSLQALQVQHATLSTLKNMASGTGSKGREAESSASNAAAPWMAAWQNMMQSAVPSASANAPPVAAKPVAKKAAAKKAVKKVGAKKAA